MTDSPWASRLTEQVQSIVREQQTPGLALAVARDGEQVFFHGFGYRNVAEQLPVTPDTVFGVASVTKSVACLAIMQLADSGRLAVTDAVVKWLPEFRVPHPEWTGEITIHHLMTHSSGLPGLPCLFGARAGSILRDPNRQRLGLVLDPSKVSPVRTYVDLLRVMSETEYQLLGAPGARFNYSNEGYALLQGIIERASGRDFLSYAQEHILDQIGMTHSTFRAEELARFPEVTELYAAELKEGQKEVFHAPVWWDVAEIYTNGSLKASAGDLLRYLEVYRTGGVAGGVRVVSEAAVRQMTTPHVTLPSGVQYGYGLMVERRPHGLTVVHHGGSIKGVASHVAVIPERGLTSVTLSNQSGFGSEAVDFVALEAAAELPSGAMSRSYPPYALDMAELPQYVGEYASPEGDRAVVQAADEGLSIRTAGLQFHARPYGQDAFVAMPEAKSFHFLRGADGLVEGLFTGVRVMTRTGSH